MLQGFQQQTAKWPVQPVEVAAEYLRGHSKKLTVADFGCGDAQLAAMASQKVHSMDLVSSAPGVIACNMAHTPLGEKEKGYKLVQPSRADYLTHIRLEQHSM